MEIWVFIVLFFLILVGLAFINYRVNREFKIETSWLALALTPVIIWLLTTQQLAEFSGFGLAFKLKEVTSTSVSLQLDGNQIKPEQISRDTKEGIGKIESFKRNRVSAIKFELGRKGYYLNSAIERYLRELTPLSFFKYVLFETQSGEFKGMISGTKLLEEMRSGRINLVKLIESGDISKINDIRTTPIVTGSSKQVALKLMDQHGLSELPVIDESKAFVGVVERGKITSSIVAQLVSSPNNSN